MSTSCFPVKLFYFPLPAKQILIFQFTVKTHVSFNQLGAFWKFPPCSKFGRSCHTASIRPTYCFVVIFALDYDKSKYQYYSRGTLRVYTEMFPLIFCQRSKGREILQRRLNERSWWKKSTFNSILYMYKALQIKGFGIPPQLSPRLPAFHSFQFLDKEGRCVLLLGFKPAPRQRSYSLRKVLRTPNARRPHSNKISSSFPCCYCPCRSSNSGFTG